MDESFRGIQKSTRLGDGQPMQGGLYGGTGQRSREGRKPRNLLTGKDAFECTPALAGALGIVKESILGAIREELGLERPQNTWPVREEPTDDVEQMAERLFSGVGQLLQQAVAKGIEDPAESLLVASERGIEQAMDTLGRLDLLGGDAGEEVAQLLQVWAGHVAKLASSA